MTLLLGPPSSGRTTLLSTLASGEINYNGHWLNEFVPLKTSIYIGKNDVHAVEMIVRDSRFLYKVLKGWISICYFRLNSMWPIDLL
ncbi:pleiotropic drug resistance 1-like, partial, partial [Olea europaea subsp. europaea]